jgi:histidine ammonia-lyase
VEKHLINDQFLNLEDLWTIFSEDKKLELSPESVKKIVKARRFLDHKLAHSDRPFYGINTGFGALHNIKIDETQINQLQENLVKSHACGVGEEVRPEIVKLMLLLKILSLSKGHSGVQLDTVQRLIDFYNKDIYPIVYDQGSLGASGDLVPLAHLSLPLMGEGKVRHKGKVYTGKEILDKFGWKKITFQAKEGLALLNGTQFMSAYGVFNLFHAKKLLYLADIIGSLSLDAFDGRIEPFDELVQEVRPHQGQIETAARIRSILIDSSLISRSKKHVQDPYSFRCIPQVHGATKDALIYVERTIINEINAVTDNPLIFPDEDKIISGGNFHGQPLALSLDMLAIAMSEIGDISERRTYQLIGGKRGLPPFLVKDPGLHSGLMIPQYTSASIVSQNKQLSTPSSVDSIESSNGQEDHVSMGANAATKALKVLQNVQKVLAIELLTAAQAMGFRKDKTSPFLESFLQLYRQQVPFIEKDRILQEDINKSIDFLRSFQVED